MGNNNNKLRQKARLIKAGLLLCMSIFATSNALADNRQLNTKDASLVAFYNDVFGKIPNKKQPQKLSRKRVKKSKIIKLSNDCVSSPPGSETEFALDLRKKREQKNLRDLFNDVTITKQTKHVKNESSRINNIDTEIFLDLLQEGENSASITLGERKVRCKRNQRVKPKAPVAVIKKAIAKPAVVIPKPKEKVPDAPKKRKKTQKSSLMSQVQKTITRKCNATPESAGSGSNSKDMSALFAKAFGKKTAASAPSKISANLRVNATVFGDLDLFSNESGSIDSADTEALLKLLEEVLKDHVLLRVKKELVKSKKTRFCRLNELGIDTYYNSTNLSLDLEIEPELRKPSILSFNRVKKASVREENQIQAEKVSGYINAFTNIGLKSGGDEADLSMRLEGSLNLNGFVFETSTDYRNDKFDFVRSTLTYDQSEKLQRFTLGNISTGSKNFQENFLLDGIRISKEFFLDPDLQISPRANESLQLDTDSEVELYINNRLIRRFYLKAGVYALEDIGLYNGANNIRIRIKDEFGKVTVKRSDQYYDSHLLKPGLSLFAFSVGYLSNQQSDSNLAKTPILSGYYQKGISENLTLSLDAQLSTENFLLGAETISSIPLGSLKNSIAVSGGKERNVGYASSFEFKPNKKQVQISLDTLRSDLLGLDTRPRGFLNKWTITGEYRSKDFSMLNAIDQDIAGTSQSIDGAAFGNRVFNSNKLRANLQTNFSLNISDKWRGSLSLGAADYYDANESYYANLSATKIFNNGISLSVGSRYDTEDEFSMNLQISIPLSRKKGKKKVDLKVLADSRDNSYETKLKVKPTGQVGKNSLAGSLKHSSNQDSKQQSLELQYRGNFLESHLNALNTTYKGSDSSNQQLNLKFNTALACVGSNCGISYPIKESFALVTGPSNQTQPIALNNNSSRFRYSESNDTGLPDNYTSLISGKGKTAVVRLESYRTQTINIDEGTLPNGYDSEKTEFSMFPEYQQGFLLKAGGEPATSLDGMLYDTENKILGFKGGQLVPVIKGKTVAFFSNKGGRFRVTSIPAGKYILELFDYPDMQPILINVPDTKGKIHNIGNLIIKTPN